MWRVVPLGLVLVTAPACRHDFAPDAGVAVADAAPAAADASACVVPSAGCDGGVAYVCAGTCFVSCPGQVVRPAAAAACAEWGGTLAQADTVGRADCAAANLTAFAAYLGPLQDGNATGTDVGWTWPDGSSLAFTRWSAGEPNDSDGLENGGENCVSVTMAGFWFDTQCDATLGFVCAR